MASQQGGTTPEAVRKRGPKDFEFGREIGSGSYSTVFYARERSSAREFAVKILDKKHIIKEKKAKYVQIEKEVLHRMSHPFIVKLFYTFQTHNSLYYVLEFASKGDLQGILRRAGPLKPNVSSFYIAEVLVGVEHLHGNGIVHRDLKPENILICANNHIKITDFGSAKILPKGEAVEPEQRNSFVGTAEYCSPELLNDRAASFKSDIWALGCILFQMLTGKPPFRGGNEYQTFQKIIKLEFDIPEGFPESAQSLIKSILRLEPEERPSIEAIKAHAFFQGITWDRLHEQPPPIDFQQPTPVSSESGFEDILVMGSELSIRDDGGKYPFETEEATDNSKPLSVSTPSVKSVPSPIITPKPLPDPQLERQKALQRQSISRVGTLVDSSVELIVLVGSVNLKKAIFSKRRGLLLTDLPRLVIFDEDKIVAKDDISLDFDVSVSSASQKLFSLQIGKKQFIFEDVEQNASRWVDAIKIECQKAKKN
ncbi:3-phosphoinositide dependent protein kinase-1 [Phlyctochytrium planicorne]|nr:3-phosphoinositide dependent protein kinase-1 [Phlyctochytrium planicorne]